MCYILHDMAEKYRAGGPCIALLAALCLVTFSVAACSRKSSGSVPAAPVPGAAAGAQAPGQQVAKSAPAAAVPPSLAARKPVAPPLAASLRAFGLGADRTVMPDDFDVGPLQDTRNLSDESRGILTVARRFVEVLASGTTDATLFSPASRPALSLLLAPAEKPAAGSAPADAGRYCLGRIRLAGEDAALTIGVPRAQAAGYDCGRLSLIRSDGQWYVEDFVPGERPTSEASATDAFDPDALRRKS